MTEEEEEQQQEDKDRRTYKTTRASSRSKMETVLICEVMCNADHKSSYDVILNLDYVTTDKIQPTMGLFKKILEDF